MTTLETNSQPTAKTKQPVITQAELREQAEAAAAEAILTDEDHTGFRQELHMHMGLMAVTMLEQRAEITRGFGDVIKPWQLVAKTWRRWRHGREAMHAALRGASALTMSKTDVVKLIKTDIFNTSEPTE